MSGVIGKLLYESDPIDEKEAQARYEKYEAQIHPQEPEELSTAVLEYAIGLAKDADITGVIDSVRTVFETALADAEQMLADVQNGVGDITQADVDASWQKLIKAMQYLSFKQGDKTDLEKVIALATEIEGKLDSYMDDGKQTFIDMLTAARDVLADGDAIQDDVNSAWSNLLKAMADLRLKPDKTMLEILINKADTFKAEAYEAESFGVMRAALATAREVLANEAAEQEEVTDAENGLKDAIAKLVLAEDVDQDLTVNAGSETETDDIANALDSSAASESGTADAGTAGNSVAKSAKTGDKANPVTAVGVTVMAMAAVLAAWKKRR